MVVKIFGVLALSHEFALFFLLHYLLLLFDLLELLLVVL